MRIALVSLEKSGGIVHCTYELAKAMACSAKVTCYLVQNDMLAEFGELPCPVRVFPLTRGPMSTLVSMISGRETSDIARAIILDRPDIVLDVGSGVWGGNLLRHLSERIPIAQIVHDVDPHPDVRSRIARIPNMMRRTTANVFVSLSAFSHDRLKRKHPSIPCIQSRHGIIVPRGNIDVGAIADQRSKVLFFGRIDPYKGLDTLVESFAIAKQLDPRLSLDIVGRGHIKPRTVTRIHELGIGLDNRYISNAEISRVASSHGIMVLPYNSATQSGVAAIALANGLPCVATSVGGLPEQIIHGRNGFIVPPHQPVPMAHAITAISLDLATAYRMAEEALRIGRDEYSWSSIGARLLNDLTAYITSQGPWPS